MIGWIQEKLIRKNEQVTGENCDYLRDLSQSSRGGFWKFALTMPLVAHRKKAPKDLWHLARISATLTEDCGPCLQTSVNFAVKDKLDTGILKAVLGQPEPVDLNPAQQAAVALGRHVANGETLSAEHRAVLVRTIGQDALAELVATAAAVRIFPAMKRGLGYSKSCSLVKVEVDAA